MPRTKEELKDLVDRFAERGTLDPATVEKMRAEYERKQKELREKIERPSQSESR
jgi:hypothetical protein